jgi:hypothetical protein
MVGYLDRLLDPLTDALTPESASALLNLRADPEVEARIEGLRRKANEGTLTPDEDCRIQGLRRVCRHRLHNAGKGAQLPFAAGCLGWISELANWLATEPGISVSIAAYTSRQRP